VKTSYFNLFISTVFIIAGLGLYFYSGETGLVILLSVFFGILLLSLNEPLQYNSISQIKVVTIITIIISATFGYLGFIHSGLETDSLMVAKCLQFLSIVYLSFLFKKILNSSNTKS
jgi:Ni,Fe-hydrogenase I cytochrome b subunit